jgi:hypothetical protein
MLCNMNPRIEKIRQLLSELEVEVSSVPQGDAGFSALELPLIVQEIVDDLQPILTAYDAAFYWFLFRHSIAKDGNPVIRAAAAACAAPSSSRPTPTRQRTTFRSARCRTRCAHSKRSAQSAR